MASETPDEEQALTGGFVNAVARVGNTVRRPSGPWTPAVHSLLRHLEAVGFNESPRVLGIDDQGREILSYIDGETIGWFDWPEVMRETRGLEQLGDLLRRYHDAVRGYEPAPDAVWRNPLAPETGEIVRHGDFAPFNTVWRGGQVFGIIDWDFAQPGAAISDLAYLAWYAVPVREDRHAEMHGFTERPDRPNRLRSLCHAYGRYQPAEVVDELIRIISLEHDQTDELAQRGLQPWAGFVAHGNLAAFDEERRWVEAHRPSLLGT